MTNAGVQQVEINNWPFVFGDLSCNEHDWRGMACAGA